MNIATFHWQSFTRINISQVHSLDPSLPFGFYLWGRHCSEEHTLFRGDRQVCLKQFPSMHIGNNFCLFRFSILLPNKWNVSFYFPNVIRFYLLFGFFPMLYTQMWHMYQLRFSILFRQILIPVPRVFLHFLLSGARSLVSSNTSPISRNPTRIW